MPELPEVETMKRGIAGVVGRTITGVDRPPCKLKAIEIHPSLAAFRRRAVGRTITGLGRVGKRVVVELDNEHRIVMEPRMTGLVLVAAPPNQEHLRLVISLGSGRKAPGPAELMFWDRRGLGSVRLVSAEEFAERYGLARVGPDALSITPEMFRERLGNSRRAIKVALLDQQAVAGVGNLYASEILHLAAVHPGRPCHRLKGDQWDAIHAAMVHVLEEAIRFEGSTLSDGTYRNALNEAGGYQNHHRVYDRADEPCPQCKTQIVRIVQAQRSTFFCPSCQPGRVRAGR